jgi:hypothetical protein
MKTFYCIIKYHDEELGFWRDLIKDTIKAETKEDARKKVKQEFELDTDLPMRIQRKNIKPNSLVLKLYEHDGKYFSKDFFDEKECEVCGKKYTMIEKYNLAGSYGDYDLCSKICEAKKYKERDRDYDNYNYSDTVVYKITQISTGKIYIGKTIRSFTLRWWEHLKSSEWVAGIDVTDLIFQVIEVLPKSTCNDEILERETYWINHYNSVNNGFNSHVSKKEDPEKDQLRMDV